MHLELKPGARSNTAHELSCLNQTKPNGPACRFASAATSLHGAWRAASARYASGLICGTCALKFSTSFSYDRRVATSTRTDVYGVLTAWLGTISFLAAFGSASAADHVTAAATAPLNSTAVRVLLTPVTRSF